MHKAVSSACRIIIVFEDNTPIQTSLYYLFSFVQ